MMPPNEPLTNEERDLAEQLSRLGPHTGPSPALDAAILSAAHASVATAVPRPAKPRWPVAFGVAASMLVAVGIAWQLRPLDEVAMVTSEAPTEASMPTASAIADDAEAEAAPLPATPLAEIEAQPADREEAGRAAVDGRPSASRPEQEHAAAAHSASRQPESPAQKASKATEAPRGEQSLRSQDSFVPAPAPAPPAPMRAPAPAASGETGKASRFVIDPESDSDRQSRAFLPDRPLDGAPAEARPSDPRQSQPRPQAARTGADFSAAGAQAERRETLDRIEVSGSRVRRTDLQVPVSEDLRLDEKAWIERIRTRQGIGDEAAARRSLELFVQAHSRASVPADLIHLLAD